MTGWMAGGMLLASGMMALGDGMVLATGQTVKGTFEGFQDHRFVFKAEGGKEYREFASSIRLIDVENPPKVSVQFVADRMENVEFSGYSQFNVRLLRGSEEVLMPATMLKQIVIAEAAVPTAPSDDAPGGDEDRPAEEPPVRKPPVRGGPAPAASNPVPMPVPMPGTAPAVRDWGRTGKWREIQTSTAQVISHGEEVDLSQALKKDVVNVVHFHKASVLSSVRQGNYMETLSQKSKGRIAVQRVIADWNSPICVALEIKSLPQFWFYSRSGTLTRKLVDRFTEADIDAALKEAARAN